MVKVIALDVYGTILASNDCDYSLPPRNGLEVLLDECKKRGVIPVTSSDAQISDLKEDLSCTFSKFPIRKLSLDSFSNFFCLNQIGGKDYSLIFNYYHVSPNELLVVDDRDENISEALILGCLAVQCPEYRVNQGREWDFFDVNLDNY